MNLDLPAIDRTLRSAQERLLSARQGRAYWEGRLSSSALSTATAVFALALVDRAGGPRQPDQGRYTLRIERGLRWLVDTQNEDGGWGDTTQSFSNISTTALVWAALVALDRERRWDAARGAGERWLSRAAGSLDPVRLARAIGDRYGKDRTFSAPILSMLALAGCLGPVPHAWRLTPQLPFELAACPQGWFRWLRLPVVSYALPALIALGLLRHTQRPSANPVARGARALSKRRALRLLSVIQPPNGGFLEATPLTSFVVMSLAASGQADHQVVKLGAHFLTASQRDDGSWPIDTNLATWVTTLSVNALAADGNLAPERVDYDRRAVLDWLLHQQYREEHPYTRAAPGGWAWSDLPGGVPDADDTSGALLALRHLGGGEVRVRQAAADGARWLLDLQNRDGGVPTFCRGWGALPFDRSSADLTAHALRAFTAWRSELPPRLQTRAAGTIPRMVAYLVRAQRPDGSWSPLWFGNQHVSGEENLVYGTSRVLQANTADPGPDHEPAWRQALARAARWLLDVRNDDGGWGGAAGAPSSIEETALAVESLASLWPGGDDGSCPSARERRAAVLAQAGQDEVIGALQAGAGWLCRATEQGRNFPPTPIGFYFAKLWYSEDLYPLVFTVAALTRLRAVLAAADPLLQPTLSSSAADGRSPLGHHHAV